MSDEPEATDDSGPQVTATRQGESVRVSDGSRSVIQRFPTAEQVAGLVDAGLLDADADADADDSDEGEGEGDGEGDDGDPDTGSHAAADAPAVVAVDAAWGDDTVTLKLRNLTAADVDVARKIGSRAGAVTLAPGQVIEKAYKWEPGEQVTLTVGGAVVFTGPPGA